MLKIRQNNDTRQMPNGMTAVELLIILASIAVVAMISVPGSGMVLEHYRLKSASSDLVESLNMAKMEALKRNSHVKVCPSSNGRFCRSDGNWNFGWLVYSDGNGDGTVQEIEFIQAFEAPNSHISIVADGAVETLASFTLAGLEQDHGAQDGEFIICHNGDKGRSRVVTIDEEGWVQASPIQSGAADCASS
jgi:type IV fimbrial biogenesis protein FimT